MAIAVASLTSGTDTSNVATSYVTASVTLNLNELGLIGVYRTIAASPAPTATVAWTAGASWTQVADIGFNTNALPTLRLTVFRYLGAAVTGTITITESGAGTNMAWAVAQVTGTDTSGTNGSGAIVQSPTNFLDSNATSISVTTSAPAANNAMMAFALSGGAGALTAGSGYTILHDVAMTLPSDEAGSEYNLTPSGTSVSISGVSGKWGIVAVEILAAAAAARGRTAQNYSQAVQRASVW